MNQPQRPSARLPLWLTLALAPGIACQVAAPPAQFQGPVGLVRASDRVEAEEVSDLFEDLQLRVASLLPDAENRAREVWIQETPALYAFSANSYAEADGFWSESHERIHLRRDSQSLPRTLAHELVHASLGESWSALPGTIEEGLCDVVSVLICPRGGIEMRTGRLSAAAFATGGLELEVQMFVPGSTGPSGVAIGSMSRVRLMAEAPMRFQAADVFTVEAGLSTTRIPVNEKKALYGLSYLLVDRIVARRGFHGLHRLCQRATRQGLEEVPGEWLLRAAGMGDANLHDWRIALQEAIGPQELQSLVDNYPDLLVDSAARFRDRASLLLGDAPGGTHIAASVRVSGTGVMLDVRMDDIPWTAIAAEVPYFEE